MEQVNNIKWCKVQHQSNPYYYKKYKHLILMVYHRDISLDLTKWQWQWQLQNLKAEVLHSQLAQTQKHAKQQATRFLNQLIKTQLEQKFLQW